MRSQIERQQRHVVLDDEHRAAGVLADPQQQRAERLGLLLGDAAGRLVEQQHLRVLGEDAGQVDDAAAAGRQLADELLAEGAEAHQLDELVDLGRHGQLATRSDAGSCKAAATMSLDWRGGARGRRRSSRPR